MALFRRRPPLHRRLAELGGLGDALGVPLDDGGRRANVPAALPPGWDGEPRGEAGIHGVPRARKWDAVVTVSAPLLRGDVVHLVALPGADPLVEEDEELGAVGPLVDAVESRLPRPFRAEAVRRGAEQWAVGASRVSVVALPGMAGDVAELVVTREGRTLRVDGRPSFGSAPALARLGEAVGSEFVVRVRRLDSDLWEVETAPL